MKRATSSLVLGLAALSGLARAEEKPADPSLFVGDPAPQLSVGQWVQGEPVKSLDKGTIYVIEFWATWCGPCVQSIPHVSALQERYKDKGVIFVGVDCREPDAATKAPPFVKRMGSQMNYRVATDDYAGYEEGKTFAAWMLAAGEHGIPTAFVVDRDGKVAWLGHPMAIDDALAQIVAGTYDPIKSFGGREAQRLMALANVAMDKDPAKANRLWDEAAKLPNPPPGIDVQRIVLLARAPKKDTEAAYHVIEHALAAPAAQMKDVLPLADLVLDGWVGPADADRVIPMIDRAAALPGDVDDQAHLSVTRFKAFNMKRDYAAAARAARALADAPGKYTGRLIDVAWSIVLRKDADADYLAVARRLIDRAASTEKTPEVATDLERTRLGLALRSGDQRAADDALRRLTESPAATPQSLQDVSDYVLDQLGDGPAECDAAVALLDRAAALAKDPPARESVARARFNALVRKKDLAAAYALGHEVLGWTDVSALVLNNIAWQIATDERIASRDLNLAERLAARAVALTANKDANYIDTYARVMFEKGDVARAVELQTQAVSGAKEWQRAELQKSLDQYKAKLAAAK